MKDYAEGSGSMWVGCNGDPRIVPGATVLLGRHREINGSENWTRGMDKNVGKRATVEEEGTDYECRAVRLYHLQFNWRVRDLVLLCTADGLLTPEGFALQFLAGDWEGPGHAYSAEWFDVQTSLGMAAWLVRTGIMIENGAILRPDRTRLDLATNPRGETERKVVAKEEKKIEMCAMCKVQPVAKDLPYCADCMQETDSQITRHAKVLVGKLESVDLSGENYISSFRNWLHRPLGTK